MHRFFQASSDERKYLEQAFSPSVTYLNCAPTLTNIVNIHIRTNILIFMNNVDFQVD